MQEAFEAKYAGDKDFLHGGKMLQRIEHKWWLRAKPRDGDKQIKKMEEETTRGETRDAS